MRSKLNQLRKDFVTYALGGFFAKGINFILLPIYTRIFTPRDYGTIEMLVVISSFVGVFLVMEMNSAQSFYFFQQKEKGQSAQAEVVTAILQWRLSWGLAILAITLLLYPVLNAQFFHRGLRWRYFAICFFGVFFLQFMNQSAEIFRLLYRPWSFIWITLSHTIACAVISLVLVVGLHWGVLGYFIGFGVGSMLTATVSWWANRSYIDWKKWHSNWWPKLIRFGAPMLPASLAMYVMETSDRWFIGFYLGRSALGMYAVAAKFAALIAFAVATFRQAWWPVAMDAMNSPDGPRLFRLVGRLYLGFGSTGMVIFTALSPWLIKLFASPSYHEAYKILGVLSWYSIFFGFYLIVCVGIWKQAKTAWASVGMGIAGLANIALNILLVPRFGNIGAAASTSLAFLLWNILTLWISERLWPIGYPLGIFGMQIGLGVMAASIILLLYNLNQPYWEVAIVVVVAILLLGWLTADRSSVAWLLERLKRQFIPLGERN